MKTLYGRLLSRRLPNRRLFGAPLLAIALTTLSVACTPIDDVPMSDGQGETPDTPTTLVGTTWTLSSYNQQPILIDTEITAEFSAEQVSGSGGCNGYFADYTLTGEQLSVGAIGSTKIACPGGILAQENDYFEVLAQAEAIEIEGDVLTITTPAGDLVFRVLLGDAAE